MVVEFAGNLEEAIEHLTEAISLNPTSAIMYATRGMFVFDVLFVLWACQQLTIDVKLCLVWRL